MKTILITQRLWKSDTGELIEGLSQNWTLFLGTAGFSPRPISSAMRPVGLCDVADLAGVLLSGGNDLSSVSNDPLSAKRDAFERAMLETALGANIPVFGVCRGMQFLASYFKSAIEKVSGHAGTRHHIALAGKAPPWFVAPASREVNSYHNWGITACGPDLEALASAPDGCVEAMAHATLRVGGIMWHPEREEPFTKSDMETVGRFFSPDGGL